MRKKVFFFLCICLLWSLPIGLMAVEGGREDPVLGGDQLLMEGPANEILSLTLSQDYADHTYYTFDKTLLLSGTAEAGALVRVLVYTLDEGSEPILWYQEEKEVGPSGLFQENVSLSLIGKQWMLIGVEDSSGQASRIYEIERKAEDTLEELIDYDLNIYEDFGR